MNREEDTDRPAASGHRFGPDLACSECGIGWDEHQRDPHPCKTDEVAEAFNRRPSGAAHGVGKAVPTQSDPKTHAAAGADTAQPAVSAVSSEAPEAAPVPPVREVSEKG